MRYGLINLLVFFIFCGALVENAKSQGTNSSAAQQAKQEKKIKTKKGFEGWVKTWSLTARISGTFDTNFGHDPVGVRSFGAVPAFEFGYQMRSKRQRIRFNYSVGAPRYTKFENYNRVGQYLAGAYRFDFGKGWSAESEAEALIKGTGEDRELNNQYIFTQNLAFRFARKNKITVYAAYRLKRKSETAEQDGENPQYGVKFSRQLIKELDWAIGYRYDQNRARGERQKYIRRTYSTEFNYKPTMRDQFLFEARFAPRLYARTVRVGATRVPRLDKKWSFDFGWRRDLTSRFGLEARYNFEKRDSNDADKRYNAHQIVFSLFYRWGNSRGF